jgi:hypothetical protein
LAMISAMSGDDNLATTLRRQLVLLA